MGFQNSAPRVEIELVFQSLQMWTTRADAAIISLEVPWEALYGGKTAVDYVNENFLDLVRYYREREMELWVYIDPANGLDRAAESTYLTEHGKSITMAECQLHYKAFVHAMNDVLNPEHLGLALETNLIRDISPSSLYQAIKTITNEVASEVRAKDQEVKLSVSIQVEWAWGKLGNSAWVGIDQDFIDFPFIQELGLSSYPYLGIEAPSDIPLDYYSRLLDGRNTPVFVSEGGWSSETVAQFQNTPQKQKEYMSRHQTILNKVGAIGLFQLTFTDIDVAAWPPDTPEILALFAHTGLVDIHLQPKPVLEEWDRIFKVNYGR